MRRSREDTAATRDAIVETASRLFRKRGIDAVGVADVMAAVGLTVGGFYRHFRDKEELVCEAIARASTGSVARQRALAEACPDGPGAILDAYLSREHRDHPEVGCPVAALCVDAAHGKARTRRSFDAALRDMLEGVSLAHPGKGSATDAKRLRTAATMVGAVVLARATDDEALSAALLKAARSGIELERRVGRRGRKRKAR
jgi:TetR/AcrR family transcriptional repressor of nem operon